MNERLKVLFAGESWVIATTHIKGLDHFTQYGYGEGVKWIKEALEKNCISVEHMPSHKAITDFPADVEELSRFDCLILSDIGANTLLLHPDTTSFSKATPNRLEVIKEYVNRGGALVMLGGYMSYQGIEGKARYHGTPVEEVLPVEILPFDDRVEVPQGINPRVVKADHAVLSGLPKIFPQFLSYNKIIAKSNAEVLITHNDDVFLAVCEYGKGRTAAFAADAAPHGASPEFLNWEYFGKFWMQLVNWLCNK